MVISNSYVSCCWGPPGCTDAFDQEDPTQGPSLWQPSQFGPSGDHRRNTSTNIAIEIADFPIKMVI